jgi:hypothetical protein
MTSLVEDIPVSGRFEINGNKYEYDVISRKNARIHFSANGGDYTEVNFSDTPTEFKDYVLNSANDETTIDEIEKYLKRRIPSTQREAYLEAWALLHQGGNAFFKECIGLLVDYHALDKALIQLKLRGIIRPRYSSVSALVHFDSTGGPGSGKNDLASNLAACIPPRYLILLSSVTPKALYYMLIERSGAGRGDRVTNINKDFFKGKIIIITEAADSETVTALKALAETDEFSEFTHSAVINKEAIDMTIRGPRCVITASVDGINDTQLKRRFIHGSISDETDEARAEKLELVEELLFEERNIKEDLRLPTIHAGFDILFVTEDLPPLIPVDADSHDLIKALNRVFDAAGYGITNIKQFYTICQCAAIWNRFARGYCRIEMNDVLEAWWLFSNVERETITKTTQNGISVLRTIKALSDEYDREFELDQEGNKTLYEAKRPTRADIVKASEIPQATVYRLLKPMGREGDKAGELFELGYVNTRYQESHTVIELTKLGNIALKPVAHKITVNGNEYEPIEPNEVEGAV